MAKNGGRTQQWETAMAGMAATAASATATSPANARSCFAFAFAYVTYTKHITFCSSHTIPIQIQVSVHPIDSGVSRSVGCLAVGRAIMPKRFYRMCAYRISAMCEPHCRQLQLHECLPPACHQNCNQNRLKMHYLRMGNLCAGFGI